MSSYTDREHLEIIQESEKWKNIIPETPEACYKYGQLQYRLKDTEQALFYMDKAAKAGYPPACFLYVVYERKVVGLEQWNRSPEYEAKAFSYYIGKANLLEEESAAEIIYRQGMCYRYGIGTEENAEQAKAAFEEIANTHAEAMYELGLYYEKEKRDAGEAKKWYRKAYDGFCEEAIFAHFNLFEGEFEEYPYQREIQEAYSFRLGRLMRIVTVSPTTYSFIRLAQMYEKGYPGDRGEEKERFCKKGEEFRKKAQLLENEAKQDIVKATLFLFPDSEIYQKYIQSEDMSAFGQEAFLSENL